MRRVDILLKKLNFGGEVREFNRSRVGRLGENQLRKKRLIERSTTVGKIERNVKLSENRVIALEWLQNVGQEGIFANESNCLLIERRRLLLLLLFLQ